MRWTTLAEKIGKNMKILRRKADLTQERAAGKADLSIRYWQQIESGQKNLTIRTLVLIARTLDVDVKDLIG